MNSDDDLRAALAALVEDEPELPSGADDIEQRGIRRRNRWRVTIGAFAFLPVLASGAAIVVWPGGTAALGPSSVAVGPTSTSGAAGSRLAVGFLVGSAANAVSAALPAGVELGELPADIGWRDGGLLALPLKSGATLTIQVAGGICTASSPVLTPTQARTVGDAVCAAWRSDGSPEIVPAGDPGPEQPELAAQ